MKEAIQKIKDSLAPYYSTREIDALIRIIFEHLMNYSPVDIIMHKDSELSDYMRGKIDEVINELIKGEPIQYIFNDAYFDGHHFKVTQDTLIPRPETEELVEMIISENQQSDLRILDVGTGSGCIALSLALAMKFPIVTAMDISLPALKIAEENATNLKVKIKFVEADILKQRPYNDIYDIIVSNPPYICEQEKKDMEKNVLDYEPESALFVPDSDPLLFYNAISKYAMEALSYGGKLYFEINNKYGLEISSMLQKIGFKNIEIRNDIHNLPRFAIATKPKENDW